eukprot:CAMPEP_0116847560 /NCGR_PEP_ID=MMETSP0418-20121206/14503_1 /TAXON_ID=1158023 /ORGANISM="Astrosyne radiata, Strain 13vi08-1A" /LENGTH=274 /DNA_ID=CAMNT_0004479021 /DNA_START=22 /DNA_END=846 /DNA_ORIENTATION=+
MASRLLSTYSRKKLLEFAGPARRHLASSAWALPDVVWHKITSDQQNMEDRRIQALPSISLEQVRLMSSLVQNKNKTLEERASDIRQRATNLRKRASERASDLRERATVSAQRGAVVAKKGAKTLGEMFRQYGPVFLGAYAALYLATLGSLYAGVSSGLLDPMTLVGYIKGNGMNEGVTTVTFVTELMEKWSFTKPYAPIVEEHPFVANLGVAWVVTKFTEPARIVMVMSVVPRLSRYFGFVRVVEDETGAEVAESKPTQDPNTEEDKVVGHKKD